MEEVSASPPPQKRLKPSPVLSSCMITSNESPPPLVMRRGPTYRDHVLPFASLGDQVPVDRVHVAERGVLLETDRAPDDGGQAVQPDLLQVHHLEGDEGVVDEQRVATDHGQVGEQAADAAQPFHPGQRDREKERKKGRREGREEGAGKKSGGGGGGRIDGKV